MKKLLKWFGIVCISLLVCVACKDSGGEKPKTELAVSAQKQEEPRPAVSADKWYEGGTLQNKSALEWQSASDENKMATCADFLTLMRGNGYLIPSIASDLSTDEFRPTAQLLVNLLTADFGPLPDPSENRKLFANRQVDMNVIVAMASMGWVKIPGQKQDPQTVLLTKKWYEGSGLHGKSALEWQSVSEGEKLATCADFIIQMWERQESHAVHYQPPDHSG